MTTLIGLFGGTFDPIHAGHLSVANQLISHLPFATIHFIPCAQPVHRPPPVAEAIHRLAMIKYAIQNEPRFVANDCEIERGGLSYTIDTARRFIEKDKDKSSHALIISTEAFQHFHHWKSWKALLTFVHVVIVNRPGHAMPLYAPILNALLKQRQSHHPKALLEKAYGNIFYFPLPHAICISSTDIRKTLAQGNTPNHFLHPTVAQYIQRHQLYTTSV